MNILILFGERIEIPHSIKCQCNECKSAGLNDSLRHSQLRLSTYRALSSDVYLALVFEDPIANAFDLCKQLSQLISNEPNLADEYRDLLKQVSQFPARLLDHIQNQIELESLLTIERLNSAIEHNQQEFLTHSNTQQRLANLWYENIGLSRSNNRRKRVAAGICYILLYIPMYIGYYWLPFFFENRCRWYIEQPVIQTLVYSISYDIFLVLLLLSCIFPSSRISLRKEYPSIFQYYQRLLSIDAQDVYVQQPTPSYWKILILIWMAGYVFRNVSQIIRQRRSLELIETLMTILFILYPILFTINAIQVHFQWQFMVDINQWKELERLHNGKREHCNANKFVFSLNLESRYSDEYLQLEHRLNFNSAIQFVDIQVIMNGVFTLTIICCIVHLTIYLLLNEFLGPFLVSLKALSETIYRWFILILIFIFANETSFLHLFAYYRRRIPIDNSTDPLSRRAEISESFGNLTRTTINIVLSLFGITKNELTQTYPRSNRHPNEPYLLNTFTSTIGSLIYGSFAFFARIIFITMIIAYIKRVYNSNKEQILNNWHFARAKFYMRFISKDPDIVPVPLNLIPTFRHVSKLFRRKPPKQYFVRKRFSQKKYLRDLNYPLHRYQDSKNPTETEVMNLIILRFLGKYHPTDVQSLHRARQSQYKEELSNIRHCILDEMESIQQANQTLKTHISTVFFGLNR